MDTTAESAATSPLHPNFPHRLLGYVIVFDTVSRRVSSLPIASAFQGAICVRSSDGSEARIAPHETIIGFTPCPDVGWKTTEVFLHDDGHVA